MSTVRNPVWGKDKTYIDCEVLVGDGVWAPFTARPDDPDLLTRVVFDMAKKLRPAPYVEPPLPEIRPEQVKAEAERRILKICPMWKQMNLTNLAAGLALKGEIAWTAEDRVMWDETQAIFARIDAIRATSDEIEATDPIPQDFRDDRHWPE